MLWDMSSAISVNQVSSFPRSHFCKYSICPKVQVWNFLSSRSRSSDLVKKFFLSVVRKFLSSRSGTSCLVTSSKLWLMARWRHLAVIHIQLVSSSFLGYSTFHFSNLELLLASPKCFLPSPLNLESNSCEKERLRGREEDLERCED